METKAIMVGMSIPGDGNNSGAGVYAVSFFESGVSSIGAITEESSTNHQVQWRASSDYWAQGIWM